MSDNTIPEANDSPDVENPYMEAAYADQSNAHLLVLAMHYQHAIKGFKIPATPMPTMKIYFENVREIITDPSKKEIEKDAALMTLIESIDKPMSMLAFGMTMARNTAKIGLSLKKD
jgi:hypothetical protein